MPTAIVRTYTGDGFIIAADGMAQDNNKKVTSLEKQKIFPFGGTKLMAYSMAGQTKIGPDEGPETWFDFKKRIDAAVKSVSMDRDATLTLYAERLKNRIRRELTDRCQGDKIRFDDTPSPHPGERGATIVYVFIDGYYKTLESSVTIRFYRHDQRFEADVIPQGQLVPQAHFYHGSTVIHDLIQDSDPRFSTDRFLRPLEVPAPRLSEAALRVVLYSRLYIEACASPEGRALDDFCKTIGGKIHMVSITPKDGIDWVPGFEHIEGIK